MASAGGGIRRRERPFLAPKTAPQGAESRHPRRPNVAPAGGGIGRREAPLLRAPKTAPQGAGSRHPWRPNVAPAGGGIRRLEAPLFGAQNGASQGAGSRHRGGQTWPPQVAGSGALLRLFLAPKTAPLRRRIPPPVGANVWPPQVAGSGALLRLFSAPKTAPFRRRIPPPAEAKCLASPGGGIRRLVAPFLGAQNGALLRLPLPSLCGICCLPRTLRDRPSVRHPGKFAFADGHFDRRGASSRTDGRNVANLRTDGCGRVRARKHAEVRGRSARPQIRGRKRTDGDVTPGSVRGPVRPSAN